MVNLRNRYSTLTKWVLLVLAVPIALLLSFPSASSLDMTNRSVNISSAVPSGTVNNLFTFIIPSVNAIGSLTFEYCINSPLPSFPCTAPPGLSVLGSSVSAQTLNTGFSLDGLNTTINRLVINRASAPGIVGLSSYTISGVVNPSTANQTVFVRIASHASTDGTGVSIDEGSVAFSTAQAAFSVGLFVPPYLTFCTGKIVSIDCSSTSGDVVSFGELSSGSTSSVTTQMAAATNDFSGYNIFIGGQTLTSGNNVITELSSQATSQTGVSQFGVNIRLNSSPSIGADPDGSGTGVAATGYNVQNQFKFINGEIVAFSPISTEFTRFTASYIVNVPNDQAPGIYSTTLTYMAVADF